MFFSNKLVCFPIWISVADNIPVQCILCNTLSILCKCIGLDPINTFNFIGLPLCFLGFFGGEGESGIRNILQFLNHMPQFQPSKLFSTRADLITQAVELLHF